MSHWSRRDFVAHAASCAAHLALAAAALPPARRARWARAATGAVVAREPFGALERVADGVWALVSTPLLGDRTTLCNGGIVAGRSGVLAVEGFMHPAGARWLADRARELTGRWPTHVAATHHHADHVGGLAAYAAPADAPAGAALRDAVLVPADAGARIDLGGRVVRLVPRAGHTASDVTLELDDPEVAFAGDLFWNAMFPNYVDAAPAALARSARALRRGRGAVYVPGHGPVGGARDLDRYLALLDAVEHAARDAHARGLTRAAAAAAFAVPRSLGEWAVLNRAFYERAMTAWWRELGR